MTSTHWSHQHFDLWSFLLNLRAHSLLLAVEWSKQKIVGPGLQVYRLATPMKTHENIVREHRTMSRETRPSFSPLPPPPETSYQSYVTHHRTKFDWTLRSHGTVPSLFTWYWRTRLNINFCQSFYHLPMRRALLQQIQKGVFKLSYHASMKPHLRRQKMFMVIVLTPRRSNFPPYQLRKWTRFWLSNILRLAV